METSLHRQLKSLYSAEPDGQEVRVDNYRIDAVHQGRLIEIQQGSLGAIRPKIRRLLEQHTAALSHDHYADALWRLGEALRQNGELDKAVDLLREAADVDPGNRGALQALARLYEQTEDWEELIRTKARRLELAQGEERFDLLL